MLPLDLTDSQSVKTMAAEIGGKVDILINTAELHRTHGIASRSGIEVARAEMDVNYFGLLRLAQEFGPVMRSRGADGQSSATAWVNLLSIYALSNYPSTRNIFGIESGGAVVVAVLARRNAARCRARDQCFSGTDRR